jgi:hypothetical protein
MRSAPTINAVGRVTWQAVLITFVASIIAAVLSGTGWINPAAASLAFPASPVSGTSYRISGQLWSVAAVSPSEAWAVGYSGPDTERKTLVLRWNGEKWSQVPSPAPVSGALEAVTATSATNAWAVGYTGSASNPVTMAMHWNGKTWSRVQAVPKVKGKLYAVASSPSGVWAVGESVAFSQGTALVMHEVGGRWYVVPTPASRESYLMGVAVAGKDAMWASGWGGTNSGPGDTLLLRWNGTTWSSAASPLDKETDTPYGLASGPGGAVWAVGDHYIGAYKFSSVAMRWTGKLWVKTPVSIAEYSSLQSAAFVAGGTQWAVGSWWPKNQQTVIIGRALIVRWTGTTWVQVPTPAVNEPGNQFSSARLYGISGTSAANAWAVGAVSNGLSGSSAVFKTVILHWNGRTWS